MTTPPTQPVDTTRLVFTSAPPDKAHGLGRALVEARVAACVQVLPGVRSIYWWRGAVQDEPESVLLCKTVEDKVEALTALLLEAHPYEVPEMLVVRPEVGLAPYLAWVAQEVAPDSDEGS